MVEIPDDEQVETLTMDESEATDESEEATDESEEATEETTEDAMEEEEPMEETAEETSVDSSLESLGDEFGFLRGDNMSLYEASKAYYESRNYEEAIEKFQAAIEYEKSFAQDSLDLPDAEERQPQQEEPSEILAKSMYWLGESYVKTRQIDRAIETFEQLVGLFRRHYLMGAAARRIAALKADLPSQESESA
ncbi:MAG: tetratricopeptide repeat protein [Candidatus Poribacteria bacterium]|nr:tetratricopeptide repeat protein [Candidatus Poribacteria bacterium]